MMDTAHEEKKSSMRRISNISTLLNNWHTITFLLLACQLIGMVRPENAVDDGIKLPSSGYLQVAGGGEGSSFKVAPLADPHNFEENIAWTDGGAEQELNSDGVMSTTLKLERPGFDQEMGSTQTVKKPRFLCLHGGGSNAEKLKQELDVWPKSVTGKMDLVFINGPFPSLPKDDGTTIGQHFEWFTLSKANTEYEDFEDGMAYIEDHMIKLGPFDGLLGFSMGALVAGALPGLQEQGLCLKKVGKIEHVILISGAKFGYALLVQPKFAKTAYDFPINIPSLHIFGENDFARNSALNLVEAYVDPLVMYHHGGHEVPKLDEEGLKIMFEFLTKINAII